MPKNLYTHERWKEFRQEVVDLDGNRCSHCGRSRKSHPGTILQVHHKRYVKGREPWDYAASDCETLCKACHAREHGKIPPVEGWVIASEMDLGGLDGTCERCGTNFRYEYMLTHTDWPTPLIVGHECCDQLTGSNYADDSRKERNNQAARKRNFVHSKQWKLYQGIYTRFWHRWRLRIIPSKEASRGYRIEAQQIIGERIFPTPETAMEHLFEIINNGKLRKMLVKVGRNIDYYTMIEREYGKQFKEGSNPFDT